MYNTVLERIHKFLGNLVRTCNITQKFVEKDDSRSGILAAAAFLISSTTNKLKGYSLGKLIFVRDIIISISIQWINN